MKLKPSDEDENSTVLTQQDNSQFNLSAAKSLRDIIAFCLMMKPVQQNTKRMSTTLFKLFIKFCVQL